MTRFGDGRTLTITFINGNREISFNCAEKENEIKLYEKQCTLPKLIRTHTLAFLFNDMSYLKTKDLSQLSYIIHHSFSYTEPYINHSSFLLLNLLISYIWSTTYKKQNLFLNFYYTCVHACVHVCVRVCPHCQPPCGGHGNTSFACLMMWLMAASPSLTM